MKARSTVDRQVLGVALGEIQTEEARRGKTMADGDVEKILRKLVKSNGETASLTRDEAEKEILLQEIAVLESLLPKTLDVEAIIAALADVAEDIKAAASDGPATGVAMKQLKSQGAVVQGKDVAAAVKKMRA